MRIGPLEIVVIIIVIIAIAVIARIFRTSHGTATKNEESAVDIPIKPVDETTSRTRGLLRKVGIAFTLTGVILLLAGISMFKWAIQIYLWSFIIVAIGLLTVFLSRKK